MTAVAAETVRDTRLAAIAEIERDILRAVGATLIAGILVGGIGGRVVMRIATLLNPAAIGRLTENGNVIGAITLEGTLALLLFGGMASALIGAVVWASVAMWIPGRGARRAVLTGGIAVALAAFFLVDPHNSDFLVLREDGLIVGLLVGLVALFGVTVSLADGWLERRVPRPGADPREFVLAAGAVIVLGAVLAVPPTLGFYLSPQACACAVLPIPMALPLLVPALATVGWWAQRVDGRTDPSPAIARIGRAGLLAAVVLGIVVLGTRVADLPA